MMAAKIHHGKSISDKVPLLPLHEYIMQKMMEHGNKIFLTNATTGVSYTFKEMAEKSRQFGYGLQGLGVKKGEIMCAYCNNSPEFLNVILGSLSAGMTVNSNNPAATPYELHHYFKQVQPRAIFTEENLLVNVEAAIDVIKEKPIIILRTAKRGYPCVSKLCTGTDDVTKKNAAPTFDVMNDVAIILFSSGTTGLPKGVMLTHHNIVSHCVLRNMLCFRTGYECIISVFPMYHAAGLFGGLICSAAFGNRLIFLEKYNLEVLLRSIDAYKPATLHTPPSVIVQLAKTPLLEKYDVTSVDLVMTGCAPIKHETEETFKKRFNNIIIGNGYGLTETSSGVIWKTYDPVDQRKAGTSGKPSLSTILKVLDPDSGELLGPNQRGEIWVKGPLIMKGYLNNDEATRDVIDADGWFRTGDVAYYDEDGYFYIVDRLKELIKYKGNQVAPAELEALLLEHSDVDDVGVVGIPDTDAGELPRAYIVPRNGSGLTEQAVIEYVNERVSHYKRLRGGVIFLKEIPKLPSGKILRRKLREMIKHTSKL